MSELCFSDYAKCIKTALQPPNDDKDVVLLLLDWITQRENVTDKNGNPVNIPPSLVTNLLKRKVNVPLSIKEECSSSNILDSAIEHAEKSIIPALNPFLANDMFENLKKLVSSDNSVSPKTQNELLVLLEQGKEAEFLAMSLLYVINRENRMPMVIIPVDNDDLPLLAQAHYECPLCHAPLVEDIKNTSVKKYEIVYIYPKDISRCANEFADVNRPDNLDSNSNKIALCLNHAQSYRLGPTKTEYERLTEIKDRLLRTYSALTDINNASLEDDIHCVLSGSTGITADTILEELPLNALRLDQKISPNNPLLKTEITDKVLRYYNYIDSLFSSMEREGTGDFELIASEIKIAFKKLDNGTLSQDEIVEYLAEWIKNKTGVGNQHKTACRIVVAYFIQNCEVFNEIS